MASDLAEDYFELDGAMKARVVSAIDACRPVKIFRDNISHKRVEAVILNDNTNGIRFHRDGSSQFTKPYSVDELTHVAFNIACCVGDFLYLLSEQSPIRGNMPLKSNARPLRDCIDPTLAKQGTRISPNPAWRG